MTLGKTRPRRGATGRRRGLSPRERRTLALLGYGSLVASYAVLVATVLVRLVTSAIVFLLVGFLVPPTIMILTVGVYSRHARGRSEIKAR